MTTSTASVQLSEIWRTRPSRLPDAGPGAGVAAGVAHRYRVDPVLVRVAFVVSTLFGGSGLVLYLAAWLTFPRAGETTSAAESLLGRGRSSESQTTAVVLAVVLAIALVSTGPIGAGSGLVSTIAMLGGWYLLHRRTPEPPAPVGALGDPGAPWPVTPPGPGTPLPEQHWPHSAPQQWSPYTRLPERYVPDPQPASATGNAPVSLSKDGRNGENSDNGGNGGNGTDGTGFAPAAPPAWDPLGVAPFAWDLPEPRRAAAPAVAAPRSSHLTSTTIGIAVVASAVTVALGTVFGSSWVSATTVGAVALAVIGLGLVVGAFRRRGYGLLVVAGPLAGFVVVSALVGVDAGAPRMGNVTAAPTSMTALADSYSTSMGNVELDLRGLELTEDRRISVDTTVGNAEVTVPSSMNVVVTCNSNVGNRDCIGSPGVRVDGTAGPDAPVLTLDATTTLGNVEVTRG
ncbi:PspC domain-containing protein [Rhodococcoides corynebacterioides]|uniref:PspC domain-containing protein n=1 Tax=Rhodococcoides corynebacterioides TaxID=53972 RepID=UPI001C9BBAA4|nr:PspC domain-containing protein [Rhodococcus corynebacterioides]MBY6363100.1 PspC domain-containing protein [Rhodococcus corynebacterioides]